jgi:hypothetical protein
VCIVYWIVDLYMHPGVYLSILVTFAWVVKYLEVYNMHVVLNIYELVILFNYKYSKEW